MTWRKVPGLPDCYEVSDGGEMRRLARERRTRDGRLYHDPEVMLRGSVTDKGYKAFKGGGGFRHITAHRAVALAFLGPCPDGEEVCHIDGDKLNNCVSNLRYDTRTGNLLDRRVNGVGAIHGEAHNKTVLTDDDVRKIRALYWIDGQSTLQIAARYNIGKVTVWQIVSGRTWTHLPMPDCGNDMARENASLRSENERLAAALAEAGLVLANERGEGEPPCEGWRYSHARERWEHPALGRVWRTGWTRCADGVHRVTWGWETGWDTEVLHEGRENLARAAMVAASIALAGGKS